MEYKNPEIEFCNECESEVMLDWDIKTLGYQAYCPFCGALLMLCSACRDDGHGCPVVCPFKTDHTNEEIDELATRLALIISRQEKLIAQADARTEGMVATRITLVQQEEASKIIETYTPRGRFWTVGNGGIYTAIDNRTGEAWTEDFKTLDEVYAWLS